MKINNSGVSLVELLVIASVGLIITVAVNALITQTTNVTNTSDLKMNSLLLADVVASRLSSEDDCTKSIAKIPFDAAAAAGVNLPDGMPISFDLETENVGTLQAGTDLPAFGLRADMINLTEARGMGNHPDTGNQMYITSLKLTPSPLKTSSYLRSMSQMNITSLSIQVDGTGNIVSCTPMAGLPVVVCGSKGMFYVPGGYNGFPADGDGCVSMTAFTGTTGTTGPPGPPGPPGPRGPRGASIPPPKSDKILKEVLAPFTLEIEDL